MKISKTHQRFADRLKEPRSLTNPEDYLGPNWEDVINFWLYIVTLSEEERRKIGGRYWALNVVIRESAFNASWVAADKFVGWKVRNAAWYAACDVTDCWVFGYATYELIASHKLLEQNKTLVALPVIFSKLK
jgi:hypothetical protein